MPYIDRCIDLHNNTTDSINTCEHFFVLFFLKFFLLLHLHHLQCDTYISYITYITYISKDTYIMLHYSA